MNLERMVGPTLATLLFFGCKGAVENPPTPVPQEAHIPTMTESATRAVTIRPEITASSTPSYTPVPTEVSTIRPTVTEFIATGDVMLGREVRNRSIKYDDLSWPFWHIQNFFLDGDMTLINLENPLIPEQDCPITNTVMVFCAPTEVASVLADSGVTVANIANNHVLDYGPSGVETTKQALKAAGVAPSNEDLLAIVDRGDTQFGFIGFNLIKQTPDYPVLSQEEIVTRIKQADAKVDVLVVSFHWGEEYTTVPTGEQEALGRAAIDAGATLVIGNHPHSIQPMEEYRGGIIIYALGNTIFDNMSSMGSRNGKIAVFQFLDDKLTSFKLVSTRIEDYGQVHIVEP